MSMTPAGYLAKHICHQPDWINSGHIIDIYSVSPCISSNFTDYINHWQHNGYWLFDSISKIRSLSTKQDIDLTNMVFFYYEVFEKQYHQDIKAWQTFEPTQSIPTNIDIPDQKKLEGYDIVSFSGQTAPECSPLSCNQMANQLSVNSHCLFNTLNEAIHHLENGQFDNCEPGPYRIFAVHTLNGVIT